MTQSLDLLGPTYLLPWQRRLGIHGSAMIRLHFHRVRTPAGFVPSRKTEMGSAALAAPHFIPQFVHRNSEQPGLELALLRIPIQ